MAGWGRGAHAVGISAFGWADLTLLHDLGVTTTQTRVHRYVCFEIDREQYVRGAAIDRLGCGQVG